MNLQESMEKLKSGSKVSRKTWGSDIYLMLVDGSVRSYQSALKYYSYTSIELISEGWQVEGISDKEFSFPEIIPYLFNGRSAKKKEWVMSCIFLDESRTSITYKYMEEVEFTPGLDSLNAVDWFEL